MYGRIFELFTHLPLKVRVRTDPTWVEGREMFRIVRRREATSGGNVR